MALDDLLSRLEGRASDTSDTPCNPPAVSAKPAPNKACTLDTPDTPRNIKAEDWALFNAWLFRFADRDDLPLTFWLAVDHAAALPCYPDALKAEPVTQSTRQPSSPMSAEEETAIRAWLALIDGTDPVTIAEVMSQCRQGAETRNYFTGRAAVEVPEPDAFPDDRRTCAQCLNLRGRVCWVATPGGLVSANKGYRPEPEILQRCAGYLPNVTDGDQRPGGERWPGL